LKRIIKPILITVVVAAIIVLLVYRVRQLQSAGSPPPRTVAVTRGDLVVSVTETGSITAADMVSVNSKVAGRILTLPIEEGQYVNKGQVVATVDRTLIDPQIASTQAQLAQAQARLQQTVASYRLQQVQTQSAIDEAKASLLAAVAHLNTVLAGNRPQQIEQQEQTVLSETATLVDAKRTLARRQELVTKGFIAQSDVDSAQVAVDTASANLAADKEQLDLLKVGPRPEDIAEASAAVNSDKVQLEAARAQVVQNEVSKSNIAQAQASVDQTNNDLQQLLVQLADTTIVAPTSGTVLKKTLQVDEIVQSATTSFSDSASTVCVLGNQPIAYVDVNEVDLPKVVLGATADVTLDALPDVHFAGRVASIAPISTNTSTDPNAAASSSSSGNSVSTYPVKISFLKQDPIMRPGMTATVKIIFARRNNCVMAPVEAIPFDGDSGDVSVLGPGNKPVKTPVRIGLRSDSDVEVVSGLTPGQKLIPNPIDGSDRRKLDINGNN
jgi:HlyD family secretion protein